MKLSLPANFAWSVLGQAAYAVTQWGLVVVVARLGSPAELGNFTYALAVTAPIVLLIGGRDVQVVDVEGARSTGEHLTQRLAGVAFTTAVIAVVAGLLPVAPATRAVVCWVGIAKGVEAIADVFHGTFHRRQRLDHLARSQLVRGIAALFAFAASYRITSSLVVAVVAMTLAWIAVMLLIDVPLARRVDDLRLRRRGIGLFRTTVVLGAADAIASLTLNVPRYAIEATAGAEALGVFAALAYVLVAGRTVASAIHHAILPRLAHSLAAGDTPAYWRLVAAALACCVGLGAVSVGLGLAAGEPFLRAVYGDVYAAHHRLFVAIIAAGALAYPGWALRAALLAAHSYRGETAAHLASLLAVVASSWMWIVDDALQAAAAVLAIAYSVGLIVRAVALVSIARGLAPRASRWP